MNRQDYLHLLLVLDRAEGCDAEQARRLLESERVAEQLQRYLEQVEDRKSEVALALTQCRRLLGNAAPGKRPAPEDDHAAKRVALNLENRVALNVTAQQTQRKQWAPRVFAMFAGGTEIEYHEMWIMSLDRVGKRYVAQTPFLPLCRALERTIDNWDVEMRLDGRRLRLGPAPRNAFAPFVVGVGRQYFQVFGRRLQAAADAPDVFSVVGRPTALDCELSLGRVKATATANGYRISAEEQAEYAEHLRTLQVPK